MASHDQEAFLTAMQIVNSSTVHGVLSALFDLNVFDIIAEKAGYDGYLHPDEIVSDLPTNNPEASDMLDRMLRLLASHSIIKCKLVKNISGNALLTRSYGLTSVSQYFVQGQDGPCLVPYHHLNHQKGVQKYWYKLKDAILEGGIPFNMAHNGGNVFDILEQNKHLASLFSESMSKTSATSMHVLLKIYKGFEGVTQVVDVGGAYGATLGCIVSLNPHVKGINFDLPHVVKNAPQLTGIDHVGGDMFVSVPKGEVIVLQRVLHDWNDEASVKILKKCYEALPDSGKVVIIEMIHSELPEEDVIAKNTSQVDIYMMLVTHGGRERNAEEFQMLGKEAGFASSKYICAADLYGVVELYKKL
ncbi:trans-anol O-methyltransferase 1-like [Apium graveolens]|uniref:trans-anol O-methyltransferase 1-like n=1 Tax=Apium graveolens TaxID=4045 RepID=UPI003D7B3758